MGIIALVVGYSVLGFLLYWYIRLLCEHFFSKPTLKK